MMQSTPKNAEVRAVPVQSKERIETVDILRGFAVLGIFVFNLFSMSGAPGGVFNLGWNSSIDRVALILLNFLVQAKFYSLFSFLFGWGMAVQMRRAKAKGAKFIGLYLRRLLVLLLFGAVHGMLLWRGDILTTYALLGFVLILFRKRSEKFLLVSSGLALLFSIVLRLPVEAIESFRTWYADITAFMRWETYSPGLYATGTYAEITKIRVQEYMTSNSWTLYFFGNVFAMFLLGLYTGKRRIFENIERHLGLLRWVAGIGLVFGVVFNGLFVLTIHWANTGWPSWLPPQYYTLMQVGTRTLGAPALMLFYVSGLTLLIRRESWHQRLAPLANVGRMALSNYIFQTIVGTLLFYHYGLGLYGEFGPAFVMGLAILIYLGQIRLSEWWLDRYQFGPLEWLWRTLTYGRRQPIYQGERYEDMKPLRWLEWLNRLGPKWRRALSIAALLAVLGGLGYLVLRGDLGGQQAAEQTRTAAGDSAALTPDAEGGAAAPELEPTPIATPVVQPVTYQPGPIAASGDMAALANTFDAERALAQIETLTGSPFFGRYAGSAQGWAASDYIATQFAAYGLQPAGVDGSYFQPFPLEYVQLAETPTFAIEYADGSLSEDYGFHEDYAAFVRWYMGEGNAEGQVVWVNDCNDEDFKGADVVDKIALCRYGAVQEASRNALEHGAAGLLLLVDPETHPIDRGTTYHLPWVPDPLPTYVISPQVADDLLRDSGKTLEDLSITFTPFALETRVHMEVDTIADEACLPQGCLGRNVLAVLPGRDPEYADEVVIVSGHYDHLGQAPNGTVWPGANDDASGIAVLLEIARSWQEQGYVPRRTVLFVAWDAEEVGLLGSSYYVEYPQYPLEQTVALIQLDMVGEGGEGEVLYVSEGGGLETLFTTAATGWEVDAETMPSGGSDHVPFEQAGVAAHVLSWSGPGVEIPDYHRPTDTTATIDIDKLAAVGRVVGSALLGLVEVEPQVEEILAARAEAILSGDQDAFLATTLPTLASSEQFWFEELASLTPTEFEYELLSLAVEGDRAHAALQLSGSYPDPLTQTDTEDGEGEPVNRAITGAMYVYFQRTEDGWLWAGPDLFEYQAPVEEGAPAEDTVELFNFQVSAPADVLEEATQVAALAAQEYAQSARLLGLPDDPEADWMFFANTSTLQVNTALTLSINTPLWVSSGTVKLVYSQDLLEQGALTEALSKLLLAEAGVTDGAAPWLWNGLAPLLQAEQDPASVQRQYLPNLYEALLAGENPGSATADWAAIDYLQQQLGWNGLGRFITRLGEACQQGNCEDGSGLDEVLQVYLGIDSAGFEDAWRSAWLEDLNEVQAELDAVFAARSQSVLEGDLEAFSRTVDTSIANLRAEERYLFEQLQNAAVSQFTLSGIPLALLPGGDVLADISLEYQFEGPDGEPVEGTLRGTILFNRTYSGLVWSGAAFERLQGRVVQVLYPEGQEVLAADLLAQAEQLYAELSADLGSSAGGRLTIKLYEGQNAFQLSVFPTYPTSDWVAGWTGEGGSVKLWIERDAEAEDYIPKLAILLARQTLHRMGVDSEWLLRGMMAYEAGKLEIGTLETDLLSEFFALQRAVEDGNAYSLNDMPTDLILDEEQWYLSTAQAWDSVRYVSDQHGKTALLALLRAQARLGDLDAAVQAAIGESLADFEARWSESLLLAHVQEGWAEIAYGFDPQQVLDHISALTDPELKGRRAGSPEALLAANYIAEQFAQYGLVPAGDEVTLEGDASDEDAALQGYFQHFPLEYLHLTAPPQWTLTEASGDDPTTFGYREDFLVALQGLAGGGSAEGELVWVLDGSYTRLDVRGKIVLREIEGTLQDEIAAAIEHGAVGMLIAPTASSQRPRDYLSKGDLPTALAEETIPVLMVSPNGYERLLEILGETRVSLDNSPSAKPFGVQVHIQVPLSAPQTVQAVNVLGLLPGSNPELADEVVILGAHYDHVGDDPDSWICDGEVLSDPTGIDLSGCQQIPGLRYSGVNDNASGVGMLLEIARVWYESGYQPERSVLFAAWGAQELGDLGGAYYAEHPVFPLEDTVALLELDAVGGGAGYYLEANGTKESEGGILWKLDTIEGLVEGRLILTWQAGENRSIPLRALGVPTILFNWRDADETNLPDGYADEIDPYRLGVSGRMVTLTLMALAQ